MSERDRPSRRVGKRVVIASGQAARYGLTFSGK
jgi:hypothetical protein